MRSAPALLAGTVLCSACFLGPRVSMDRDALRERGKGKANQEQYRVIPLTPEILTALAKGRQKAKEAQHKQAAVPTPVSDYRVSVHDVLSVIVWEHPELTIPAGEYRSAETTGYPVSSEGTIFFPHVGTLAAAGRTVEEIRRDLTQKLAAVVREPQLQVLVASYRGKRVQIAGEVAVPSWVPITDVPLRVQDAIAAAKGFTLDADPGHVTLVRGNEVHPLDLFALYQDGDASQNWLLQDGDIVHVPDRSHSRVFVLGEVKKPAALVMPKGRMTLADALGGGEGIDLNFADPGEIYVFRGSYDAPQIYLLNASSPDALLLAAHFELEALDVVYVSTSNIGHFGRVAAQIIPTIQALQTIAFTYQITRHP